MIKGTIKTPVNENIYTTIVCRSHSKEENVLFKREDSLLAKRFPNKALKPFDNEFINCLTPLTIRKYTE